MIAFLVIGVAGVAGCLLGGWASDRYGRARVGGAALAASGACCLASPLLFDAPPAVLACGLLVWGAAVIADSGVFSTLLSEVPDQRYVGTALTAQTAIGFLLTVVTMALVSVMAALVGWRYAFVALGLGPALDALAMRAPAMGAAPGSPRNRQGGRHDLLGQRRAARRRDRGAHAGGRDT